MVHLGIFVTIINSDNISRVLLKKPAIEFNAQKSTSESDLPNDINNEFPDSIGLNAVNAVDNNVDDAESINNIHELNSSVTDALGSKKALRSTIPHPMF